MKKLLLTLLTLVVVASFSTPVPAVQRGGAGASAEEAYVCGSGEANSIGATSLSSSGFVSGLLGAGWRISSNGK